MRRFLACVMAIALVVGLAPAAALADEARSGANALSADGGSMLKAQAHDYSFDNPGIQQGIAGVQQISAESIGIGGGGAVFAPAISPHDQNTFITGCDMGGVYVTHNAGGSWTRHEACGQTMNAVAFDPTRPGYVYAGSSGLARSRDNGDTWELLWPKAESVLGDPSRYEAIRHYYYNTGNWDATSTVKAIAVDPDAPTHLYVLAASYLADYGWNLGLELYQSLDDGATFTRIGIAPFEARGIDANFEDPRVIVRDGVPFAFTQTGVYRPGAGNTLDCVRAYDGAAEAGGVRRYSLVSADLMSDGRIAVAEALDEPPASGMYRPRTSLRLFNLQGDGTLTVSEDLTSELGVATDDFPLVCDRYGGSAFSVGISRVRASGNRLYFINASTQEGISSIIYLLGLCDLGKASGQRMRWVYGFPLWNDFWKNDDRPFDEYDVVDRGHSDTFYQHYGLATDPNNPKAFLLGTAGGCFYSEDCDFRRASGGNWPSNRSNIRQLYTKSPASGEFATTGINEQTTYGLRQDPFDPNHLSLLYTDVGLWSSGNGGESWSRNDTASVLSGNVYDLAYDQRIEGLAYAAWSAQHDAPYQKEFATYGARGGFARSADGGATWSNAGTGLPDQLVPMRMAVVYPTSVAPQSMEANHVVQADDAADENRTVWLATFGRGFWRSGDGGQSFTEANAGVSKTSDNLILGADIVASADDAHVFALTTRDSTAQGTTPGGSHGRVYEWDAAAGTWRALLWPAGSEVECPKTLFWDEASSTLYVSCVAAFDRTTGDIGYVNFGGGLFTYKPGDASLAAVDAGSSVVGDTCSVEGCTADSAGNLFVSDLRGNVFLRKAGETAFAKLYSDFHIVSKDVQLVSQSTGANGAQDDILALPTFGGGLLRLNVSIAPSNEDNGGNGKQDDQNGNASGGNGDANAAGYGTEGDETIGGGRDTSTGNGNGIATRSPQVAAQTASQAAAPSNSRAASATRSTAPPATGDPFVPALPMLLAIAAATCTAIARLKT